MEAKFDDMYIIVYAVAASFPREVRFASRTYTNRRIYAMIKEPVYDKLCIISRTNVTSVGSVYNDTRKVKVLSLPEMTKKKSFQEVREPLPFTKIVYTPISRVM